MILDTTFLIDLLRGRSESVKKKAEYLDRMFVTKATTSISLMELWRGVFLASKFDKEKKKLKDLSSSLLIYNFDDSSAKIAGEIEADLKNKGEIIDLEDIMISAICISNDEVLITRNIKHFSKVKGLKFEKY